MHRTHPIFLFHPQKRPYADNDIDIKPIAKNGAHFKKWSENYPFYANIKEEGVVLYGAY